MEGDIPGLNQLLDKDCPESIQQRKELRDFMAKYPGWGKRAPKQRKTKEDSQLKKEINQLANKQDQTNRLLQVSNIHCESSASHW